MVLFFSFIIFYFLFIIYYLLFVIFIYYLLFLFFIFYFYFYFYFYFFLLIKKKKKNRCTKMAALEFLHDNDPNSHRASGFEDFDLFSSLLFSFPLFFHLHLC